MQKAKAAATKEKPTESYDVAIVGMGMAGMSAAVFACRAMLKVLIVGEPEKSQLWMAKDVGNYLCMNHKTGPEILEVSLEQIKEYGATAVRGEAVHAGLRRDGGEGFEVKTAAGKSFFAKTLVIASGATVKMPGIPGERPLIGKGVHTCVACDGFAYKGKKVWVVGGASYAAEEALELLAYTKDVTIVSNGKDFDISPQLQKILKDKGVALRADRIKELKGDARLSSVILADGKEEKIDGLFLAIGTAGAFTFAQKLGLETDEKGFIKIDRDGKTSADGVWAAGGCTGGNEQIAKSVGEGCNAAISIIKRMKGLPFYTDQT
jgi:thioredoxin reductase (NADPH)